MALSEENGGMVMPVSPYYGGNGNGDGMFGNGGWWIILMLLIFGNGMWGWFRNERHGWHDGRSVSLDESEPADQ